MWDASYKERVLVLFRFFWNKIDVKKGGVLERNFVVLPLQRAPIPDVNTVLKAHRISMQKIQESRFIVVQTTYPYSSREDSS